jgi:hypothetical protein
MATVLNANNLKVSILDANATDKPLSFTSTNDTDITDALVKASLVSASAVSGTYIIKNLNGTFNRYGVFDSSGSATFTTTASAVLAAATSSTLDFSNSISDVARDGAGGTLQELDKSFTISAEGLVQNLASESGRNLVDVASAGEYLMLEFDLDNNTTYAGLSLIDSISITGSVDEIATYSATFSGIDDLLKKA